MAGAGLRHDRAAVGLDDRTGDRQPEPAATAIARPAIVETAEAFEDVLELFWRYSRPGVADRDLEDSVVRARNHPRS